MRENCRYAEGFAQGRSEALYAVSMDARDSMECRGLEESRQAFSYIGRSYWLGYMRGVRSLSDAQVGVAHREGNEACRRAVMYREGTIPSARVAS